MESTRWQIIQEVFEQTLALKTEDRAVFLEERCGDDPELREEVESLLNALDDSGTFLDEPAVTVDEIMPSLEPDQGYTEGRQIGPYSVKREIGRGGMGVVYLAERSDGQFEKEVAIKVVQVAKYDEQSKARFLAERQILARLDHPNIARLLDGGVTDDGLPYLVMEHVSGIPITSYCDSKKLNLDGRLDLFRTVCDAVHHAHQNLVVHRDLKPSNILVTKDGVPKLLDFGIAKLIEDSENADAEAPVTRTDMRMMTPEYASPEQIRAQTITTATDTYSLGVMLYELLTGHRPYRLKKRKKYEIERIICEEAPPRPSTAVTTVEVIDTDTGEQFKITPESVGAARGTDISRLKKHLAGDLDNIILMAMRKEPTKRYASVRALEQDIGRFQGNQPVIARKPTIGYRARKFVSRNRGAVAAAAVIGSIILISSGLIWSGNRQLSQVSGRLDQSKNESTFQRERGDLTLNVLKSLFDYNDPNVAQGETLKVVDFLDRSIERINETIDNDQDRAELLNLAGELYQRLGVLNKAGAVKQAALDLNKRQLGDDAPETAVSMYNLAAYQIEKNEPDFLRADSLFHEALNLRKGIFGDVDHPSIAQSLYGLGWLKFQEGKYPAAEEWHRMALAMRERLRDENHPEMYDQDLIQSLLGTGAMLHATREYTQAQDMYQRAEELAAEVYNKPTLEHAELLDASARLLQELRKLPDAEVRFNQALSIRRKLLGDDHFTVARSLHNIAFLQFEKLQYDQSLETFDQALALRKQSLGEEHREVAQTMSAIAMVKMTKGDYEAAEDLLRQTLQMQGSVFGGELHPDIADTQFELGRLLYQKGAYSEAEQRLRECILVREFSLGERTAPVAEARSYRGKILRKLNDLDGAAQEFAVVLEIYEDIYGEADVRVANAMADQASVLMSQGLSARAEYLYTKEIEIRTKAQGDKNQEAATAMYNLAKAKEEKGMLDEAENLMRSELAIREEVSGPTSDDVVRSLGALAGILRKQGTYAEAEDLWLRELGLRRRNAPGGRNQSAAGLAAVQTMNNLASMYLETRRADEAERMYRDILDSYEATYRADHPQLAEPFTGLGEALFMQGKAQAAYRYLLDGMKLRSEVLPPSHPQLADTKASLGGCLVQLGRYAEAETYLVDSFERLRQVRKLDHPSTQRALRHLIKLYETTNRETAAARYREFRIRA